MTMRKLQLPLGLLAAGALAGCSTPGPLHVYLGTAPQPETILDLGNDRQINVPSFLKSEDQLTGLAYDPFTDHLFLRLAPGNKIRVVDRPARAIKREFTIEGISSSGGGDLAVRPRDGHIFLLENHGAAIAETNRFGKLVRTFTTDTEPRDAIGIAVDSEANRLLLLHADRQSVTLHNEDGRQMRQIRLDQPVGGSLAVDGEHRELYAPLETGRYIGVFNFEGKLLRRLPEQATFVDVGQRSFVRVF